MIAAAKARARRRRRRLDRRQLRLDFARQERLEAFERKLADPPPPRPDEPERLGDILAQILSRRL